MTLNYQTGEQVEIGDIIQWKVLDVSLRTLSIFKGIVYPSGVLYLFNLSTMDRKDLSTGIVESFDNILKYSGGSIKKLGNELSLLKCLPTSGRLNKELSEKLFRYFL